MSLIETVGELEYHHYDIASQEEFTQISLLISDHLSEPYSIYVYWYFLNTWPQYCFVVKSQGELIGVIISKVEIHRNVRKRGYIGMLAINPKFRQRGIARHLVKLTVNQMIEIDAIDEIMLETEINNFNALKLYEGLGFLKIKRLYHYYLNTHDAYRLVLPLSDKSFVRIAFLNQIDNV